MLALISEHQIKFDHGRYAIWRSGQFKAERKWRFLFDLRTRNGNGHGPNENNPFWSILWLSNHIRKIPVIKSSPLPQLQLQYGCATLQLHHWVRFSGTSSCICDPQYNNWAGFIKFQLSVQYPRYWTTKTVMIFIGSVHQNTICGKLQPYSAMTM